MTNENLGKQLKLLRMARGMTLDEASDLTGVSKPMLGQIERGQSSPTINTLWKIATGLKTPLSSLLRENASELTVTGLNDADMIQEENGSMRAYTLFPFDPARGFEAFYIEFDAGCRHISGKHNDNVEETVFVIDGKLDMIVGETKITLRKNQALRFAANVGHTYHNPYGRPCRIYNTIFY